jgi:hypothetical protein
MLRWSIGSRCRVQVTSNVRLPKDMLAQGRRQDTRSGMNPRQRNSRQGQSVVALSKAETTGVGFTTAPTSSDPQVHVNLESKPLRFAGTRSQLGRWGNQKVSQLNLPPSGQINLRHRVKAAGTRSRFQCSEVLCCSQQSHGILGRSGRGIVLQPVAGKPNHSVNLTRNSVPHLPGMARYAHNALPGKRVTLPRAGYLKR